MTALPQLRIPATYMCGGTSKGVFFRLEDLPEAARVPGPARDALLKREPQARRLLAAIAMGCLLAVLANNAGAADARVTRIAQEEVLQLGTADLAALLLPRALAVRALSHRVRESLPFPHRLSPVAGIRFQLDAWQSMAGVCRRDDAYVPLDPVVLGPASADAGMPPPGLPVSLRVGHVHTEARIALGVQCAEIPVEHYAYVRSGLSVEQAALQLRWFQEQRALAASGQMTLQVTCSYGFGNHDPCLTDTAALLASIPLERTFDIESRNGGQAVQLAVMPDGPGHPFWQVLRTHGGDVPDRVQLHWTVPAPF